MRPVVDSVWDGTVPFVMLEDVFVENASHGLDIAALCFRNGSLKILVGYKYKCGSSIMGEATMSMADLARMECSNDPAIAIGNR
jgi:hypothetical protein